jgi:hypothetical protein
MKSLSKVIDQIIGVEPSLEGALKPIKKMIRKRSPMQKHLWESLLTTLNTRIDKGHPSRAAIIKILMPRRTRKTKRLDTYLSVQPDEQVIGTIPEFLETRLLSLSYQQISIAKQRLEAVMTNNASKLIALKCKTELWEIRCRKIWFDLKNHFKLWNNTTHFDIRHNETLLVLVQSSATDKASLAPCGRMEDQSQIVVLDNEAFKQFLRFLNIKPPTNGGPSDM